MDCFKKVLSGLGCLLLVACATEPTLTLNSSPPGAEIIANKETVGRTPASFKKSDVQKYLSGSLLPLTLRVKGYAETSTVVTFQGDSTYEFALKELNANDFRNSSLFHHAGEANALVRELLVCQGLVFSKNFQEAIDRLKKLQTDYPNIAASYVLEANVYILTDKTELAEAALKKALELDENDANARRLLSGFTQRATASEPKAEAK